MLAAAMCHGQALHAALTQARREVYDLAQECARLAITADPERVSE